MKGFWLTKSYRPLLIIGFLLAAGTVAMNLGLQSTSSYLIAKAARHPSTILLLWVPIVAVRFFGTARAGMRYGDRYYSHDVTLRWLRDLKTRIYQAVEPKRSNELKAYHSGDLLMRVGADVDSLQNLYVGLYEPLFVAALGTLIVLAIGLIIDPTIGLALMGMLIVSGFSLSLSALYLGRIASRTNVQLRSRLSTRFVEALHGMTDLIALNLAPQAHQELSSLLQQVQQVKQRLNRLSGLFSGLSLFITWAGMWLILEYGILQVERHQLRGILLPVVALLALASFEIVASLPAAFQDASGLKTAQSRITQLTQNSHGHDPSLSPQRQAREVGVPELSLRGVNLTLGQPGRAVLKNVSLNLPPAHHVALVGANGSGKSSLVNLVSGLIAANSGTISLNGTPLELWDVQTWREHFSVVNQFPYLFHTSVRQNLLLANPQAPSEALHQAIAMAGLETWLASLPDGWDTLVGERGTSLSGGELKRFAMARAILKDAPILLLDEPTEGLDPISERTILGGMMGWAHHKSVLWITHNLVNLDLVDEMIIIDHGSIVEYGRPEQLADHPLVQQLSRQTLLPA